MGADLRRLIHEGRGLSVGEVSCVQPSQMMRTQSKLLAFILEPFEYRRQITILATANAVSHDDMLVSHVQNNHKPVKVAHVDWNDPSGADRTGPSLSVGGGELRRWLRSGLHCGLDRGLGSMRQQIKPNESRTRY